MATPALVARAIERWQALSPVQRVALGLAMAGVIAALIYITALIGQYRYAPLFTGLAPDEAGDLVARLKDLKVPYRLADQGTTIQVPRDQVYEVRIQLASSGALDTGGPGFELFDRTKLGITEFEQQVNYQRALQGELQRTIVQLDEVQQARVHLVIPQKTVFDEEQPEPSASIALKLKPLTRLKPEQVQGIISLVTGSVEGLKPENVHVIDMAGRILSDEAGADQVAAASLTQQQVKRAYEKELEKRVQQMLERVLGPGKAVAMVSADLDFSRQETVISAPEGEGVVVSEQTNREQGAAGAAGGAAGAQGNLNPPGYETQAPGGEQGYTREETTRNYQVGTRQDTIVQAPGTLRRLSAAVVVDGDLTAAKRQEIERLVATAVGFNAERGDQILVSAMGFDTTYQKQLAEDEAKAAEAAKKAQEQRLLAYAIAGAAGLLLFMILGLVLFIRRRRRRAQGLAAADLAEAVTAEEGPVKPPPPRSKVEEEKMRELARERPQEVADIIKVWLKEE